MREKTTCVRVSRELADEVKGILGVKSRSEAARVAVLILLGRERLKHLAGGGEPRLPVELRREIFGILSGEVARQVRKRGLREDEILEDFASWRKAKRKTARQPGRKTSREAGC
jgi:hypothetical protein